MSFARMWPPDACGDRRCRDSDARSSSSAVLNRVGDGAPDRIRSEEYGSPPDHKDGDEGGEEVDSLEVTQPMDTALK